MAEIKVIEEFKERKQRRWEGRPNYTMSTWGRKLQSERVTDPTGRKGGKLFRRRFRVPSPIFLQLVQTARASGEFTENPDAAGDPAAPLELKILAVLRVLGKGYCFDGVKELTCISAEVLRVFDLKKSDGTITKEKGLYLIMDGGYHKWRCLECPLKHTSIPKDALWSKWFESVRKDAECVFGILKGRFR